METMFKELYGFNLSYFVLQVCDKFKMNTWLHLLEQFQLVPLMSEKEKWMDLLLLLLQTTLIHL